MIKHAENVDQVKAARAVEAGDVFMIEIDYVTPGGIVKTMCLPFRQASRLRGLVMDAMQAISLEERQRSFFSPAEPK